MTLGLRGFGGGLMGLGLGGFFTVAHARKLLELQYGQGRVMNLHQR